MPQRVGEGWKSNDRTRYIILHDIICFPCTCTTACVSSELNPVEKKGIDDMVVPVYISLDPSRDTIGQLKHYAKGMPANTRYVMSCV